MMEFLNCKEIIKASKGELLSKNVSCKVLNVCTDSRKVKDGDLFIPLVGPNFDGHDYIDEAFAKGAVVALTQKNIKSIHGKALIKVNDTLRALNDIALYYRLKFQAKFIAITGSVGKTTTKDFVASVLSQYYNVLKTEGNFNNEIGVPFTLFNLNYSQHMAVIEMGMNSFGEISRLSRIVKPDIAIITNIGLSHIEKLGSRQNIFKAKMEILEGLNPDGLLILNGDDNLLFGLKSLVKFRTVFYGFEESADYQAFNIKSVGEKGVYFDISLNSVDYTVHVPIPGIQNVYNALAAIAVGREMKVPIEKIISGIQNVKLTKMRQSIVNINNIKIINDAYNASPQSMEASINVLKEIGVGKRKIAILGDMLELGDIAYKSHIDIGKYVASKEINYIITVGKNAENIAKGALDKGISKENIFTFDNNNDTIIFLKSFLKEGDVVLVKGSRGMKMDEIVNGIT